jgi:hypothetical protein
MITIAAIVVESPSRTLKSDRPELPGRSGTCHQHGLNLISLASVFGCTPNRADVRATA